MGYASRATGTLLAALAATAAAAAGAFAAAPEIGRCVATAGGHFQDPGCSKPSIPGIEKYEWHPGAVKTGFHSVLKEGIPTLETVSGTKITCKTEESPGQFTSSKTVGGVLATFTGCETAGLKCTTGANPEGMIRTAALEGTIGVEKVAIVEGKEAPAKNKLAWELRAPAGQNVAEFACAGLPVIVRGSVLHPITANKMLLSATEKFTATAGEQKPDKFAGGPVDQHTLESNTNGGPFEEAGQTITALSTAEEKLEASTVN